MQFPKIILFFSSVVIVLAMENDGSVDDEEVKLAMNPDLPRREFKRDGFTFVIQNADEDMVARTLPDKPFRDTMHLNYKESAADVQASLESDLEWLEADLSDSTRAKDDLLVLVVEKPENCHHVAEINDTINMQFTVRFNNISGLVFAKTKEGQPIQVDLNGQLPMGWEEGVLGACEGEERQLTLKPSKSFGKHGTIVNNKAFPSHLPFFVEFRLTKLTKSAENSGRGFWSEGGDFEFFDKVDANNDRNIDRRELYEFVVGRDKRWDASKMARAAQLVRQVFRAEDEEYDGQISFEEFVSLRGWDTEEDENNDSGLKIEL